MGITREPFEAADVLIQMAPEIAQCLAWGFRLAQMSMALGFGASTLHSGCRALLAGSRGKHGRHLGQALRDVSFDHYSDPPGPHDDAAAASAALYARWPEAKEQLRATCRRRNMLAHKRKAALRAAAAAKSRRDQQPKAYTRQECDLVCFCLLRGMSEAEIAVVLQRAVGAPGFEFARSASAVNRMIAKRPRLRRARRLAAARERDRKARRLVAAIRECSTVEAAAQHAGVARATLYRAAKQDSRVARAIAACAQRKAEPSSRNVAVGKYDGERTCIVYAVAEKGGDYIKVGRTTQRVKDRRKKLQSGNARELVVLSEWRATYAEERRLHRALARYHVRGEWFRDCPAVRSVLGLGGDQLPLVVSAQ